MDAPKITLRYFDARGRAQFLRAYFSFRGVDFQDERVPLDPDFSRWLAVRSDRSLTGPMQRLPVLHYDDDLIPETLVIAGFAHRRIGDAEKLSESENLQHDVLLSSVYVDLMLPTGTLIWADLIYRGVDLPALSRSTLERLDRTLVALDRMLGEWNWTERTQQRPVTLADCLLWEVLDQAATVFGPHLALENKPELHRFYAQHPGRERFEELLAAQPCQITGRPGEREAIANIQALLAEAGIA
jgi:hypothetical protein